MCIAFLAYRVVPGLPIILAANRDEYYKRPTQPLHFWEDNPSILAGRDLRAGGTWLGVSRQGRLAFITNYRELQLQHKAPSRGALVRSVLEGEPLDSFGQHLCHEGHHYHGFNLIYGTVDELFYFSNRAKEGPVSLTAGIHGLSNALLDSPWPKILLGKELFAYLPPQPEAWTNEALFGIMADRRRPEDHRLPQTGVGVEVERILASIFITTEAYGTRCTTVVKINDLDLVETEERTYRKIPEIYRSEKQLFTIARA